MQLHLKEKNTKVKNIRNGVEGPFCMDEWTDNPNHEVSRENTLKESGLSRLTVGTRVQVDKTD